MRIGIVGTRGLPPKYGGYETFADELATRFVARGHKVAVFCEKTDGENSPDYKGIKLVYFPFRAPTRYWLRKLYEGIYDCYSYVRMARECDLLYVLAGLGTPFFLLAKLLHPSLRFAYNMDGIEWRRAKFNWVERNMIRWDFETGLFLSHLLVLDAKALERYVRPRHLKKAVILPYGADVRPREAWNENAIRGLMEKAKAPTGLSSGDYWLVVARLQPDNNTHIIVDGYLRSGSKRPLVVVGGFWDTGYEEKVRALVREVRDGLVRLVGGVYDKDLLRMLRQHAFGYIHGHSAGGTNPSLLEAMAAGNLIVAHANEFNQEVCGKGAIFFGDAEALAAEMREAESRPELVDRLRADALTRVQTAYTWSACVEGHELTFMKALAHGSRPPSVETSAPQRHAAADVAGK